MTDGSKGVSPVHFWGEFGFLNELGEAELSPDVGLG